MGTPTPPPPIIGDDCLHCWAAGATPLFIQIEITGIEACPCALHDTPAGYYWLEQSAIIPCRWNYEDDWHQIQLTYGAADSQIWIRDAVDNNVRYFWNHPMVGCVDNFANDYGGCVPPNQCGFDGTIIVL